MTESVPGPIRLTAELDGDTPVGVAMWVLEKGKQLPGHCPVSAARFTVQPGARSELDVHEVVEVWTVMRGRGTIISGAERITAVTGDSVYFDSNVPHQLVNSTTEPIDVFSVWWSKPASGKP